MPDLRDGTLAAARPVVAPIASRSDGGAVVALRDRSVALVAGVLAAVLCGLDEAFARSAGRDAAAQAARASFARQHPVTPIDLSWFGGLAAPGYSVLSPPVLAVLGVGLTGALAAAVSSVQLARLVRRGAHPAAAAWVGSVCLAADVISGRTTYALALVPALAAVALRGRRRTCMLLAVVTALTSPVAAAGLAMVAAGLVLHRRRGGWPLGAAAVAATAGVAAAFSTTGVQPLSWDVAVVAALAVLTVAALTADPVVRTVALIDGLATLVLPLHQDAFGSNVVRLGVVLAAPVLLATVRPGSGRLVTVGATLWLLLWQTDSTKDDLRLPAPPPMTALRAELLTVASRRTEVVPLVAHTEAGYIQQAVPIARGWNRQVDVADNRLFYDGTLSASTYLAWLHANGVDHVAVPVNAELDSAGVAEAALVRSGVPGLTPVWSDGAWTVLAVDDPTPLADPPLQVVSSGSATLVLSATAPGTGTVRLRWSPYLSLIGPGCLRQDGDQVSVTALGPGTLTVGSSLHPAGHCG